jgi:hypothetical protein
MNPTLRIETDDGAEIRADGRGFAARDGAGEREWRVAATLRFRTDDARYAWLNGALGLWEGTFDAERHIARYRAYLQRTRPREGARMASDQPMDALTAAGIAPQRRGGERLRALTDDERRFYRWILRSFGAGSPPGPDALPDAASAFELEAEPALDRLRRLDLVHHNSTTGAIVVAYPFSGRPTSHRVRLDGREVYAMCAIDALGIAPMLGERIEIASRDPLTAEEIRVELEPDRQGSWLPQQAVVVSGTVGSGESRDSCCPVLSFFASTTNAGRWLAAHPDVEGTAISTEEAVAAGRTVFGDLLKEE